MDERAPEEKGRRFALEFNSVCPLAKSKLHSIFQDWVIFAIHKSIASIQPPALPWARGPFGRIIIISGRGARAP
jgi:hypothetical protein